MESTRLGLNAKPQCAAEHAVAAGRWEALLLNRRGLDARTNIEGPYRS